MKGSPDVIKVLNDILRKELTGRRTQTLRSGTSLVNRFSQ